MTDRTPDLRLDPENLLPPIKAQLDEDEVDKVYSLTITELTPEQFEVLSEGIFQALSKDPRNWTAKVAAKVVVLGLLMVFLAACIWAVAQILTPLTNR